MPQRKPRSSPADARRAEESSGPRSWRGLVGSIRVGQAVITLVLLVVGMVRAIRDDVPVPWAIAVAVVFAGWYFGGLVLVERSRDDSVGARRGAWSTAAGWWLVGLTLIWVGAVVVSPEFVWLAFSLWLLAGFLLRLRWALLLSVLVLIVVVVAPVAHTGATSYANVIGPLIGGVFALGISRGYLELVRDGQERRRLIESLVAAQEEMAELQDELARSQRESGAGLERTRLSRDIHDTVAQSLSSIGMIARAAEGRSDRDDGALGQIQELAREGLGDARRIVDALMPAELEGSALGDALRRMLARLHEQTGIRTDLHVDSTVPALPVAVEVALLRTAQSALANTRAHAGAHRVVVSLTDATDAVRLDVVDDGIGFDATGWNARERRRGAGGYGLRSMRARLRELGGELDVESAPGDGTALSASVPLSPEAES